MAVQNRLKTRDRLKAMNIAQDDLCGVCGDQPETIEHLMFNCHFSWQCMDRLMCWLQIKWRGRGLTQTCRWLRGGYKRSKIQRQVALATTAAVVYAIWRNRNKAYWDHTVSMIDKIVQEIKFNVKKRCLQLLSMKVMEKDRRWIENL